MSFKADDSALSMNASSSPEPQQSQKSSPKGLRFWLVLVALLLSTFLAVLEAVCLDSQLFPSVGSYATKYAVSTVLPTIVEDLRADEFIWVANAYAIASSALLPLSGGLSEVRSRTCEPQHCP